MVYMHRSLSRLAAVAAAAVLTTMSLPIGSAAAATSNDCNPSTSTKLLTGGLFGNTTDHLWVDYPSSTRTVVCFQFQSLSMGGFTVIFDAASGATLPSVDVDDQPGLCPNTVVTLQDPVPFRLAVGLAASAVCLTVNGSTVSVQFDQGNIGPSNLPVLEIWRDGGPAWGWIDVAACPAEWAIAVAFGGPTTCMSTNDRIFP